MGDSTGSFDMTVCTEMHLLALEDSKWIINAGPVLFYVEVIHSSLFLLVFRFILFVERAINWHMCLSRVLVFTL